jgi:hypothetical protein
MSAQPKEQTHASPLDEALELAAYGFYIFPLAPNAKKPAHVGWQDEATCDREKIRAWAEKRPDTNFGIFTGRYGHKGDAALLAVDVDVKNGKDGEATLKALEQAGKSLEPSMGQITGSGGRHLIYQVPSAVRQGVDVLGNGLDIRSSSGFIVAPGAMIGGKRYTLQTANAFAAPHDYVVQLAPAWLVEACGAPRAKALDRTPLPGVDPVRARARGIEYLETAERSVKGAGGDQCAYAVAAALMAIGNDPAATLDLMLSEHWEFGCGWAPDRLAEKVAHADQYMQDPRGADAPEAQFEAVEVDQPASVGEHKLHPFDELNKEWAAVAEPPNTVVYRTRVDTGTGQRVFERYTREGFFGLLANQKLDGTPLALKWWESNRRKTFHGGTDFAPSDGLPADVLNTWGGFAVQPAPGDWSLMRQHIRNVICGGGAALDRYVMGWLACAVQRPGSPGQVALVLRGARGTGKGTLGEMLCKIFGQHGMHVGNAQRLTGNFNGHLAGKVLLFADEAFYAGDRKHEGILKALITERALDVEAKYQAARNVRNCLHILMASNDEWVVPAGAQERRFCVIDVSDVRQQDNAYFGQIRAQMAAGGLAAMLHDLLAHDLAGFDVWDVPHTTAGTEQKTDSLRGVDAWLFDALAQQRMAGVEWGETGMQVAKDQAYVDYRGRSRELGDFKPDNTVRFWLRVGKILHAGGVLLQEVRSRVGGERVRQSVFPPIEDARRAFEKYLGGAPVDWGDG